MYLLDTNVVSELRRAKPHGAVIAWLRAVPEREIFLAAMSIFELQAGVELARMQDTQKAAQIEAWIDTLMDSFAVLPADGAVFRRAATLLHGHSDDLFEDALIAATALENQLTVATRNVRDFVHFGVTTMNPFQ